MLTTVASSSKFDLSLDNSEKAEIAAQEIIIKSPEIAVIENNKSIYEDAVVEKAKTTKSIHSFFTKFSLIGYSMGYGNTIMIPALFLNTGRVAYFIPLLVCYIIVGIPIMMIEAVVGQYSALHPNIVFSRISPILNSIGGAFSMVTFYRTLYFMPLASWLLFTAYNIVAHHPMDTCYDPNCFRFSDVDRCSKYYTNSVAINLLQVNPDCLEFLQRIFNRSGVVRVGPVTDLIQHKMLNPKTAKFPYLGIGILFGLWFLLAALIVAMPRHINVVSAQVGRAYMVITIIMFVFTCVNGKHQSDLFTPQWEQLFDPGTWVFAVLVTLFSLSLCDGGIIRLTSVNEFNNNIPFDVIITISLNFIFAVMHVYIFNTAIGEVMKDFYPGLNEDRQIVQNTNRRSFESYFMCSFPEFSLRVSEPWIAITMSSLYYVSLVACIFVSSLVSYESLLAAFIRRCKVKNKIVSAAIVFVICAFSAAFCAFIIVPENTGLFFIFLDDGLCFLSLVAFIEVVALGYFYGYENFCRDIENMIGWRPTFIHYIEIASWKGATPLVLGANICLIIGFHVWYLFAQNSNVRNLAAGKLAVLFTSLIVTPVYIGVQLYRLHKENRKLQVLIKPTSDWGRYQPVIQDDAFHGNSLDQTLSSDEHQRDVQAPSSNS